MREILTVAQPCVLCEATMEVWVLHRDDETGAEEIERTPVDHDCPPMRALLAERQKR